MYVELGPDDFVAISVVAQNFRGELPEVLDAGIWADALELDMVVLVDTTGAFWAEWNPPGVLPMTYVIDRDGLITWRDFGDVGALPEIREHVKELLEQ